MLYGGGDRQIRTLPSLSDNSAAMALLVLPAAIRRVPVIRGTSAHACGWMCRLGRALRGAQDQERLQVLKHPSGRVKLESGCFIVAEGSVRQAQQDSRSCRGIWSIDLLPCFEGTSQGAERRFCIAFCQFDGALSVRGRRPQDVSVDIVREFLQFATGAA